MNDNEAPVLSVRRQCELLGLNRSSFYYQAVADLALNLYLDAPYFPISWSSHWGQP